MAIIVDGMSLLFKNVAVAVEVVLSRTDARGLALSAITQFVLDSCSRCIRAEGCVIPSGVDGVCRWRECLHGVGLLTTMFNRVQLERRMLLDATQRQKTDVHQRTTLQSANATEGTRYEGTFLPLYTFEC